MTSPYHHPFLHHLLVVAAKGKRGGKKGKKKNRNHQQTAAKDVTETVSLPSHLLAAGESMPPPEEKEEEKIKATNADGEISEITVGAEDTRTSPDADADDGGWEGDNSWLVVEAETIVERPSAESDGEQTETKTTEEDEGVEEGQTELMLTKADSDALKAENAAMKAESAALHAESQHIASKRKALAEKLG